MLGLCDEKDLYSYAPLCEGWGGVVEWQGEGFGGDSTISGRDEEPNPDDVVHEAILTSSPTPLSLKLSLLNTSPLTRHP